MEDFFIFIGIIAIGAVVLYLIYIGVQEKDDKAKENEELFQYVGDEDEFDNKEIIRTRSSSKSRGNKKASFKK